MFARTFVPQARVISHGFAMNPVQPARGMATLKDLRLRINATKNISKITKSMKMIASTKLVRAQREMNRARSYGAAVTSFYDHAETTSTPAKDQKNLMIAVSSDKGLCGGIHSSIARQIKGIVAQDGNYDLISLGDKAKAQIARVYAGKMVASFASLGNKPPTFNEAAIIANTILRLPTKYSTITLVHNQFKSAISFDTIRASVHSMDSLLKSPKIDEYEVEDDVLQNLQEFNFANTLYAAMADGYAAEIAAKMNAMDNATKNAGELINKLTIVFNRTRQAAITTELVDIITGASAL